MELTKENLRKANKKYTPSKSIVDPPESLGPERVAQMEKDILEVRERLFDITWDLISKAIIPLIENDIDPNKKNPLTGVLLLPVIKQVGAFMQTTYLEAMNIYYGKCETCPQKDCPLRIAEAGKDADSKKTPKGFRIHIE